MIVATCLFAPATVVWNLTAVAINITVLGWYFCLSGMKTERWREYYAEVKEERGFSFVASAIFFSGWTLLWKSFPRSKQDLREMLS